VRLGASSAGSVALVARRGGKVRARASRTLDGPGVVALTLPTAKLAAGSYALRLTLTDAAGQTASDGAKLTIKGRRRSTP
jgi:hypothetical protein